MTNPIEGVHTIISIADRQGNPRTDGRYPLRVGRRCQFYIEPRIGRCMLLEYCPREGEDYSGYLKTSTVQESQLTITGGEVVTTFTSVYYLEPTE